MSDTELVVPQAPIGVLAAYSQHKEQLVLHVPMFCAFTSGSSDVIDGSSGNVVFRVVCPKAVDVKHGLKGVPPCHQDYMLRK